MEHVMPFELWQREAHGELSLKSAGDEMRIFPRLNGWHLHCSRFEWFSDKLEELVGFAEFYEAFVARHVDRCTQGGSKFSESLGDGFELSAVGHPVSNFEVRVDHAGICVGRYQGFLNSPLYPPHLRSGRPVGG
jgi:hypothetical protein